MKKFKVLGVMVIMVLILAASMGSVSAKKTWDLNGVIFTYNNGENGATSPHDVTIRFTFGDNGKIESWKVVNSNDYYNFITSDPSTIPKYVAAIKIYLGDHLEPLWP